MAQYDQIAEEYLRMSSPTKKYVSIPLGIQVAGNVEGKTCADLACGNGLFTHVLLARGAKRVVGVDNSARQIELARNTVDNPDNVTYIHADVRDWNPPEQFDVATAIHLLNYAQTADELTGLCASAAHAIKTTGRFAGVTINPALRPMDQFEYGRKFYHPDGKSLFENGDEIWCDVRLGSEFTFRCKYWTLATYEESFREAGFSKIKWVDAQIAPEGIAEFGNAYWNAYRRNSSPLGFICTKD